MGRSGVGAPNPVGSEKSGCQRRFARVPAVEIITQQMVRRGPHGLHRQSSAGQKTNGGHRQFTLGKQEYGRTPHDTDNATMRRAADVVADKRSHVTRIHAEEAVDDRISRVRQAALSVQAVRL